MRLHQGVRLLAALTTAAALTTPAASARTLAADGGGAWTPTIAHQHQPASSTDWPLIAAGSAGAIILLGAGATASRRAGRARHTRQANATSSS
jgi:hypothetical protein